MAMVYAASGMADSTTPGKSGVVGGEARAVLQGGMAP